MYVPPPTEAIRTPPVAAAPAPAPGSVANPAVAAQPHAFTQAVRKATGDPPTEVLSDLDAAAVVAATLEAGRRQLHFEYDKRTGQLEVEVRDSSGDVVRRIPPTEALRVALGAPIDGAP